MKTVAIIQARMGSTRPLKVAIQRFQERENYREKCFKSLGIDKMNISLIIDGIDLLAKDVGLSPTIRVFDELPNLF